MKLNEMISKEESTRQVKHMGYLFGLLYYHFAKTLISEFGYKKGKALIRKTIRNYGIERGKVIREKVLAASLELTLENFFKFQELPSLGWEHNEQGVTFCSYAQPWIERGEQELGKLYCEIDYAKAEAYNPKIKLKQVTTILDGDTCCSYTFEEDDG